MVYVIIITDERGEKMSTLLSILIIIIFILFWKKIINEAKEIFDFRPIKQQKSYNIYSTKNLMTKYERYYYDILLELKEELNIEILPQVNLASIINKGGNSKYRSELFRNIDFGIFTKNFEKILLLIEINDKTHNTYNRRKRDLKVDAIVNNAGIKLIKFYSNYPNKKEYVKNRIKEEINKI